MELWKQKLESMKAEKDTAGILHGDITGVKSDKDTPDNLFYTEFSERDAQSFFAVFTRYKETYATSNYAIETLEKNLKEQIWSMARGINPIEVVLYASRCIKECIYSDDRLTSVIKGIVAPRLNYSDCEKIAWHILGGWEWLAPVCIFVESIGESNKSNLIAMAMKYYPRFAQIGYETNERRIFESYLKMIFATQNIAYNNYIVDIVTDECFARDNDLVDKFLNTVRRMRYLSGDDTLTQLLDAISERPELPSSFRIKINRLRPKESAENDSLISNTSYDPNAESRQRESISLQFGRMSRKDIATIKNIRDESGIIVALRRVMAEIDNIYPEEQRGDAYILLGTKGVTIKSEVVEFLQAQVNANSLFTVPIYIALQELGEIGYPELLKEIYEAPYHAFWVNNVANYCRYRTRLLGTQIVPYFSKNIEDNLGDEELINSKLFILKEMLTTYDGRDHKINKDALLPESLLAMISLINFSRRGRETYDYLLSVLEIMRRACPSKKNKILKQLDDMKVKVADQPEMKSVVMRIDGMIQLLDNITAPQ